MQNTVNVVGTTPAVSTTNAKNGKALQLDGTGCLYLDNITMGGQDFTVDFWVYLDSTTAENSRIFSIRNKSTDYMMVTLQRGSGNAIKMWYSNYEGCTQDNGTTKSYTNSSNIGNLIHIAIVYQNKVGTSLSQPTFRVYINGTQRMVTGNNAPGYIEQNCRIEIGGLCNGNQKMIGALDEIAIHNGVRLWTGGFTPPTSSYYDTLEFGFDTNLIVRNPPMEWKYSNPGDGSLLTIPATTVSDPFRNRTVTQTGFYQNSRQACFGIAATKELWFRCDISGAQYANGSRFRIYSEDASSVNGINCYGQENPPVLLWHNGTEQKSSLTLMNRIIYTIWLHMKSDATNGKIEYRIYNDEYNIDYSDSYTGNVNNGADFANFYIQMDGTYIIASNIMIANTPIDISEGWLANIFSTNLLINTSEPMTARFDTDLIINAIVENGFDTYLNVTRNISENYDTNLEVYRTETLNFDTVINYPYTVSSNDSTMQSVSISLQEQQLTDNITFTHAAGDAVIMSAVDMRFLDYVTVGRIEETSTRGVLQTCKCTCDIDAILYQQMAYEVPESDWEWTEEYLQAIGEYNETHEEQAEKVPSAPASAHITNIAAALEKNVYLRFDDFISTMSTKVQSGTNYAGLISELFGWTSRLPQMMINCYVRGDTIYVIQRGMEANTVVLDNLELTVYTISKKIVRTTWGSDPWSKTEVKPFYKDWSEFDQESYNQQPYYPDEEEEEGGASYGDDNLVEETTVEKNGQTTVTTYKYETMPDGRKFLCEEVAVTYVNGVEIDRTTTTHKPVSDTQSHIYTTDQDGEYIGGTVSQSNHDDRVSPYQKEVGRNSSSRDRDSGQHGVLVTGQDGNTYLLYGVIHHQDKGEMMRRTINGVTLIDTSFPVDGQDKLEELTQAIIWLNRKTEESVMLDVYDYSHVIDFNDKISWHGNTYYLRSNSVSITETVKNKQTLEFVRWY